MTTLFHLVPRYAEANGDRFQLAWSSWFRLYGVGELAPLHVWSDKAARDSRVIGDSRRLAFVKDLLNVGLSSMHVDDLLLMTNDDVTVNYQCPQIVRALLTTTPVCTLARVECPSAVAVNLADGVECWSRRFRRHPGRDGFAFTKAGLEDVLRTIPDFCVGAPLWDTWMAWYARSLAGPCDYRFATLINVNPKCETPYGALLHVAHPSYWSSREGRASPANRHNEGLFANWFSERSLQPDLSLPPINEWFYL